jgi:hypothetical protein
MQSKDAAIRKRTQIARANRVMFGWVAAVSVVVGFALVGSVFLTQKLIFNEKVQAEKDKTVATLQTDNNNIPKLEAAVRVIDTNEALSSDKANATDQPIQVILDALPSDANSLALGASIQSILQGTQGLTIQSQQVDPVIGVEQLSSDGSADSADVSTSDGSTGENQITFTYSVSGTQDVLKLALQRLEKSIRVIDITNLHIESQGTAEVMTFQGHAYYEPSRVVQLENKVVRP